MVYNRHNTRHNSRRSNNHHNNRHNNQHSSDAHMICSLILDLSICYNETCRRILLLYLRFSCFYLDMTEACKERDTCS